jgi:hypothetical protein
LAEVEARRQLVDWIFDTAHGIDGEWGHSHSAADIRAGKCSCLSAGNWAAVEPLRLLALPYSQHADYRPRFAPEP